MSSCWGTKPDNRPSFSDLVDLIGGLLSSSAGYLDLHIDNALIAAEELSTTEYSYVDPNRMFSLMQSLRSPVKQLHRDNLTSTTSHVGLLTQDLHVQGKPVHTSSEQRSNVMDSKIRSKAELMATDSVELTESGYVNHVI